MFKTREANLRESERRCQIALKSVCDEATKLGLVVIPGRDPSFSTRIDDVYVRPRAGLKGLYGSPRPSLQAGDFGTTRTYQVKPDGSVNIKKILDHIQKSAANKREEERLSQEAWGHRIADEKLRKKLAKLHRGNDRISVQVVDGKVSVEVDGLTEPDAIEIINSLNALTRNLDRK